MPNHMMAGISQAIGGTKHGNCTIGSQGTRTRETAMAGERDAQAAEHGPPIRCGLAIGDQHAAHRSPPKRVAPAGNSSESSRWLAAPHAATPASSDRPATTNAERAIKSRFWKARRTSDRGIDEPSVALRVLRGVYPDAPLGDADLLSVTFFRNRPARRCWICWLTLTDGANLVGDFRRLQRIGRLSRPPRSALTTFPATSLRFLTISLRITTLPANENPSSIVRLKIFAFGISPAFVR